MFPSLPTALFLFLYALSYPTASSAASIDTLPVSITTQPSFTQQRLCVQYCLGLTPGLGLGDNLGCGQPLLNNCYCRPDLAKSASAWVSSCFALAFTTCTGDYSSAVSVYDEYCGSVAVQDAAGTGTVAASTSNGVGGSAVGGATAGSTSTSTTTPVRPGQTVEVPGSAATITIQSSDSGSSQSGGLSTSDKIALGCGLGLGVPTMIATIYGVWQARRRGWVGGGGGGEK